MIRIFLALLFCLFIGLHQAHAEKYDTVTVDADEVVTIATLRTSGIVGCVSSVWLSGTFGSGTITLKASIDDGTTKIALKDLTGTAVTVTANDIVPLDTMGWGAPSEEIILYASMSGATNPDVDIALYDCR